MPEAKELWDAADSDNHESSLKKNNTGFQQCSIEIHQVTPENSWSSKSGGSSGFPETLCPWLSDHCAWRPSVEGWHQHTLAVVKWRSVEQIAHPIQFMKNGIGKKCFLWHGVILLFLSTGMRCTRVSMRPWWQLAKFHLDNVCTEYWYRSAHPGTLLFAPNLLVVLLDAHSRIHMRLVRKWESLPWFMHVSEKRHDHLTWFEMVLSLKCYHVFPCVYPVFTMFFHVFPCFYHVFTML